MSTASDLTITNLWKGYRHDQPVLRGVDLTCAAGTLTAVLGMSGCGKTTLLRVIAGFERAQGGAVRLGSRTLDDTQVVLAPEQRQIGYVPQEWALFPHLSVRANIAFGLSRSERRGETVDHLLDLVGLGALADRMPSQLSGGEQQRTALARALARKPALLLLDEPFSSLDASLRGTVREEVSTLLRRQGTTTVLVTHDQDEALSLADSLAVLRDGRIIQQGEPATLYSTPVDVELASFLGAANLLAATFVGDLAVTALGKLPLRSQPASPTDSRVIVRPEQLVVSGEIDAPGMAGTVERCSYYGHDATLQIRTEGPAGPQTLIARVSGEQVLEPGRSVVLRVRGPVTPAT